MVTPLATTMTAHKILIKKRKYGETSFAWAFNLSSMMPILSAKNEEKRIAIVTGLRGKNRSEEVKIPMNNAAPLPRGIGFE